MSEVTGISKDEICRTLSELGHILESGKLQLPPRVGSRHDDRHGGHVLIGALREGSAIWPPS